MPNAYSLQIMLGYASNVIYHILLKTSKAFMKIFPKLRIEVYVLFIIAFFMLIFLSHNVFGSDVWDRPLLGYNVTNNITINITNNYYYTYNDTLLWQALYDINQSIWQELGLINIELDTKLNQSQADLLYYSINNPAGYINFSTANQSFYPLTQNPAGYINQSLADSLYLVTNATHTLYASSASYNISSINISFEITRVDVVPSDNNPYRFELTEYPSGLMIDRDRQAHIGVWSIQKNHALDSRVLANITSGSANYNITIYYETQNG